MCGSVTTSWVGAAAGGSRLRAFVAARVSLRFDDTSAGVDEQQEYEALYGPLDGGLDLEDLFVEPEARGLGAGKALLRRLAQRCIEAELGRLEWSVLNWNAPSIAFYDSLGASAMDDWTVRRLTGEALERLAAS